MPKHMRRRVRVREARNFMRNMPPVPAGVCAECRESVPRNFSGCVAVKNGGRARPCPIVRGSQDSLNADHHAYLMREAARINRNRNT